MKPRAPELVAWLEGAATALLAFAAVRLLMELHWLAVPLPMGGREEVPVLVLAVEEEVIV